MPYDRDEVVAEVLSFYEFLTTLHLPEDCIKRPPGGEWPQITSERFAALGKTDIVIDLLRHLPYIARDGKKYTEDYKIWEHTICVDYTGARFENSFFRFYDRDAAEPTQYMEVERWDRFKDPEHLACIARSSTAKAGYQIFIDTRDGQWLVMEYVDGVHITYNNARDLWEQQKNGFRELDEIPVGPTEVLATHRDSSNPERIDRLKQAFGKHGWPTQKFRREECMNEVAQLWRKPS
jgi:hypothetical protein